MLKSPWKHVRARQDFKEQLFLNLNVSEPAISGKHGLVAGEYYVKITLDTTAGFFELPNDQNGGTVGRLLDDEPETLGEDQSQQFEFPHGAFPLPSKAKDSPDALDPINHNRNKGPLFDIALASFDQNSFVAAFHNSVMKGHMTDANDDSCKVKLPMIELLTPEYQQGDFMMPTPDDHLPNYPVDFKSMLPCIRVNEINEDTSNLFVTRYLLAFVWDNDKSDRAPWLSEAFTQAAFLSHDTWMQMGHGRDYSLCVLQDFGVDRTVVDMSLTTQIIISILMGVYLTSLLVLAIFVSLTRRWTEQLDAFAMMRIGASVADKLSPQTSNSVDKVQYLDELPGWIGDDGDGKLQVGGAKYLQPMRKYLL